MRRCVVKLAFATAVVAGLVFLGSGSAFADSNFKKNEPAMPLEKPELSSNLLPVEEQNARSSLTFR
jgi:hypothetical protein